MKRAITLRKALRFLLRHAPVFFLAISAAFSLAGARKAEIALTPGDSRELGEDGASLGSARYKALSIRLENFDLAFSPSGGVERMSSVITIEDDGTMNRGTVDSYRAMKHGALSIRQKAWNVGVRGVRVSMGGEEAEFKDRLAIPLPGGGGFLIRSIGYDGGLVYRWAVEGTDGHDLAEGSGRKEVVETALRPWNVRVVEEDYALFSVLEIWRKPGAALLAAAASLFIVSLAMDALLDRRKGGSERVLAEAGEGGSR